MRNRFFRWLTGATPRILGVYWGIRGVCLVLNPPEGERICIFQPPTADGQNSTLSLALQRMEILAGISRQGLGLAVAIEADDVFVRSLRVSAGLSERQVEQVSIVEAVASLPVPPEEICLDFIRSNKPEVRPEDTVRIAFCRREVIDEILAESESLQTDVLVVDRDVQALHDAALAYLHGAQSAGDSVYPFAILLTEHDPRLLICLDALALEMYPLRLTLPPQGAEHADLTQQISNCWTRCRMAHGADLAPLRSILVCSTSDLRDEIHPEQMGLDVAPQVVLLPTGFQPDRVDGGEMMPPDEVYLVAAGMAGRTLKSPRFNLMPHREMAITSSRRILGRQLSIAAAAGLLCASAGAMVLERQLADATSAGQVLINAIAELAPLSRESRQLEQRYTAMLERQRLIESLDARRSTSVLLLADVAESMSRQMYLVRFEEDGERFVIEGRAVQAIAAGDFLNRLAASEYLDGLALEEVRLVDRDAPAPYQFRIRARVKLVNAARQDNTGREAAQ